MDALGPSLIAVLGASLVGSLHCVGMCGGFATVIGGVGSASGARREIGPTLAYQGARGLAYTALGAIAGLLGAGLDEGAGLLGLQRLSAPLMGVTLIAIAIGSLWPRRAATTAGEGSLISLGAGPSKPGLIARLRLYLARALRTRGLTAGAAAGLLSALLPCGWLWAYVIVAASTGSPGIGALVMAVFWAGSVPALLGAGLLAGELGRRLGAHAPKITAAAMLALGLLSLAGKLTPKPMNHMKHGDAAMHESGDHDDHDAHDAREQGALTEHEQPSDAPVAIPQDAPCH
ncbi:sulfite exporter TauE/SafE family protein [Pseudenhygromyxa sp. WMMC2535]|uniref:sulfite exporter TauE/SafE family protein n=1 Tax=Pseudenhygromyxa sp. WMMC2535 TaxID=2712867 RepID=UPI0015582DAF|nr:sulfite exporter TauE/SafE family protein [Pseudenhygromyxa sp. WMMC2535]NVB40597.1 sulfite exporter TauE/SafE family protein [Pseudenhygromyxa sp. WMMC2535]